MSPAQPQPKPAPLVLSQDPHYLEKLFVPNSVAVIGASERAGALGTFVFANVVGSRFHGPIYPVNPKYQQVKGVTAFSTIEDLPETPDLIVVATPAATVPGIIRAAGKRGVRAAVVLTAGFAEIGAEGSALGAQVKAEARKTGLRVLGPNCIGIIRPSIGLNATFANAGAKTGSLALVAQSGAVCTAILDWAAGTEIGFSSVVSLGGALDLDFGEILDYLLHDPKTKSILLYVEGVRDARRFMSALRAASRVKPVIVFKAGRDTSGSQAVTSHTGALAGRDKVWDSALARAGAVRVESSLQLFAAARLLADPRIVNSVKGNRLAIVTNGGGPGVVAADAADRNGLRLATLSATTLESLDRVLPKHWSRANPIDIVGDAPAQRFRDALAAVVADTGVDAVLTMYCPQSVTPAEDAAAAVIPVAAAALAAGTKPVFTSWLGGRSIIQAKAALDAAGIPNFLTPESAVDAFSYLARFQEHQKLLRESVSAAESMTFHDLSKAIAKAHAIRERALSEKRTLLQESEAKALLDAFQLPVSIGATVQDGAAATRAAAAIGYPVALKIDSPDITHKSDAGGVRLNLMNARQVKAAFEAMLADVKDSQPNARINGINVQPMLKFLDARELLVGVSRDPTFGPVIAFGAGGVGVEVINDMALALPPLNDALAENLIGATAISRVLGPYRNVGGIDQSALKKLIVRVSTIASVLPWVREMDINPVLAHPNGVAILDARVVIDADSAATDMRYKHMAIFPYPVQLERELRLKDGTLFHMRAIRPDDAARERAFVAAMSETSRYYRFMHSLTALSDDMIARFTQLDYDREMALIALTPDEAVITGVARYSPNADGTKVEFAIAIGDHWQGKGLGELLMRSLINCARDAGYAEMEGSVLQANQAMLALASRLGFSTRASSDSRHVVRLRYILTGV
jgi:acetyltransferase